jgi:hypothetical protein
MKLTYEEKIKLMKNLNWNFYLDKPEDMLAVIEGKLATSGGFDQKSLFVQSLERLAWHNIMQLWNIEVMKKLYTPELKRRLRPQLRGTHDFAFAILRGEAISAPEWSSQYCQQMRHTFLSDRWNGNK